MISRADFEKTFPVPENIEWVGSKYRTKNNCQNAINENYNSKWEGWMAAKASQVMPGMEEGYSGVTVWIDGHVCTQLVDTDILKISNADELSRLFENACHLITRETLKDTQ